MRVQYTVTQVYLWRYLNPLRYTYTYIYIYIYSDPPS